MVNFLGVLVDSFLLWLAHDVDNNVVAEFKELEQHDDGHSEGESQGAADRRQGIVRLNTKDI